MNKKAQVTIFIIIAIFIVGAILIFFLFKQNIIQNPFSQNTEKIQLFVETCIENTGEEVIYNIGLGGGYYFPPELSTSSGVPYYYVKGENFMPSKKYIEEEISFWISQKLFFCTKNFVDFPDLRINQREIETRTKIKENEVILNVKYPIRISKGEDVFVFEDFKNIKIPVRMGIVYDAISEVQRESSESICLSCMVEITEKNDLYVDMINHDETSVIFFFEDKNSVFNEENFMWIFANKYEVENE